MKLKHLPVLLEKQRYIFRHYPRHAAPSLLFTGCYFPAFFPRATRALQALATEHDTACAFDCCGKPLLEMGREADARRISDRIDKQVQQLGVKELITVCPNCCAYLQGRLSVPLRTVYDKLAEWGVTRQDEAVGQVFLPCPDRRSQTQLKQIRKILPGYRLDSIVNVPCCGLGGAFAHNRDTAQQLAAKVKRQVNSTLYTYCASCAGQLQRQKLSPVRHVLAEILHVEEAPDTAHSLYNRWQFKRETT